MNNNLKEQLTLLSFSKKQSAASPALASNIQPMRLHPFSASSSRKTPCSPHVKPRLSFSKPPANTSSHARSLSDITSLNASLSRGTPRSMLSLQRNKTYSTPISSSRPHKPTPPVALVTPVNAKSHATVEPVQGSVGRPSCSSVSRPLPAAVSIVDTSSPRVECISRTTDTGKKSFLDVRDTQVSPITVSSDESVLSPKLPVPGSSLAFCQLPSATTTTTPTQGSWLQQPTPNTSQDLELELRRVQEERLAVTDSVCEILADIPSSEMASLFRASAGHVQKKLAMRKKLLLKEESLKRCLSSSTVSVSTNSAPHGHSPSWNSPLPLPPWAQSNTPTTPATTPGQSSYPSSKDSGLVKFTSTDPSASSFEGSEDWQPACPSTGYIGGLRHPSSTEELRPTSTSIPGISRHFEPPSAETAASTSSCNNIDNSRSSSGFCSEGSKQRPPFSSSSSCAELPTPVHPTSSGYSGYSGYSGVSGPIQSSPFVSSRAPGVSEPPWRDTPPRPPDVGPDVVCEEDFDAVAAEELEAMQEEGHGWDLNTQDILITESEMDLVPQPPRARSSAGQQPFCLPQPRLSSEQDAFRHPVSSDIPVRPTSSVPTNRSTFKPPFLQQSSGQFSSSFADLQQSASGGQLNSSFAGSSGKPSMFKPAAKNCAPQDDASEFRGQYQHTREMYKIFHQVFGLKKFRPNQLEAVNAAILGKDCFILMPTGGGKSLCYQLPALMTPGVTVVVSPLRSLMQDQIQKLTSFMIPAKHLSSDLSFQEEREVYDSLAHTEPVTKLLYVTPEKLGASNKLVSTLRGLHSRKKLARFVIDEAHCISQWGHDFRPDYKKLSQLRQNFSGVPIMALTATATPRVRADILFQLKMQKTCKWFTQSFNRTNLKYLVVPKKPKKVFQDIIDLISKSFPGQSGIVYCLSRRDCEVMAGELCRANIAALCYHAGLSNEERCTVQQRWIQEDRCKVVCATIAFGMGIDKPDVRFVIHHSLPKSVEGYYQEAGRAGRDGLPAQCILFYSYSDMARLRRMVKAEKLRYEQEKVHMDNLYRMVQYCENMADCRRMQLLEYFAENFDPSLCKGGTTPCDNCQSSAPFITEDVTDLVKVIVRSVEQIGKDKYTLNQYLEALKGSGGSRTHGELRASPLFGQGSSKTKHDLERLLHKLVMEDILSESLTIGSHENVICYVKSGGKARDVLNGRISNIILKVKGGGASSSRSDTTTKALSKEDTLKGECLKALTALRLSVTTKCKLKNPEYVVPGTALRAMADQLPVTEEEILNLEGYTRIKWDRFDGPEFLKITQEYAQEVANIQINSRKSSGKTGQSRKTSSTKGTVVTSDYFKDSDRENQRPVLSKGKRKKTDSTEGTPLLKKQAFLDFINDVDSEDDFDLPKVLRPSN